MPTDSLRHNAPCSAHKIARRIRGFIDALGGPAAFARMVSARPAEIQAFYETPLLLYPQFAKSLARFGCDDLYFATGSTRSTLTAIYDQYASTLSSGDHAVLPFEEMMMLEILKDNGIWSVADIERRLGHARRGNAPVGATK